MAARNSGRYLAPIALAAVIVAIVLVVSGGLATTHSHVTSKRTARPPASHHVAAKQTFYIVKSGDVLSVISARIGISVPTLESLNPGLNPNALQTGQRLKLRN
jgi:LysM repeat protein